MQVKVTSLGQPELLRHLSQILHQNRRVFRQHAQLAASNSQLASRTPMQQLTEALDMTSPHNPYLYSVLTKDAFVAAIGESSLNLSRQQAEDLFERMDDQKDGVIDYIEWMDHVSLEALAQQSAEETGIPLTPSSPVYVPPGGASELSKEQLVRLQNMLQRSEELAKAARASKSLDFFRRSPGWLFFY